ncbi:MAG TPA: phosphotransferase [Solirubrobacteraceae bacterium]|nr:phosphotransferase [Solirubrobacteraceae bacterium]
MADSSAGGVDFFARGALPAPRVGVEEAVWIAGSRFGLDATAHILGSQQDQNFLLRARDGDQPLGVLKLANPAVGVQEIEAQIAAGELLARRLPDVRVATTLSDTTGAPMFDVADTSEGPLVAHVVSYLSGETLLARGYLSPVVIAAFGNLAARVSLALAEFDHPGLERVLQWDLRNGARVVELLLDQIPDGELRERLESATAAAARTLTSLAADALPLQPGHFDLTDENVLTTAPHGIALPDGVIDLGDLSVSWRVAELATTIGSLLHHPGAEPHSLLPAVTAFQRVRQLTSAELDALWPLVVIRGAVLTVSSHQQVALDGDHTHASTGLAHELELFSRATSVPAAVMTNLIRAAVGETVAPTRLPRSAAALVDHAPSRLDLSTRSDLIDDGAWLDRDAAPRLIERELVHSDAVALPHALPQLTRAKPLAQLSQPTVPTVTEVWFKDETELSAPWPGNATRSRAGSSYWRTRS